MTKLNTDCIRCKRWKLFNEKPCAQHPDFKTDREIVEEGMWKKAQDGLDKMMFVAALRVYAAMARQDLFDRVWTNLCARDAGFRDSVVEAVRAAGPMTTEELERSIMSYALLMQKTRTT